MSLLRFPLMVLYIRRPASLHRVPPATVPRLLRYYQAATTPRRASLRLIVSPAGTTPCLLPLCSRSRAPCASPTPLPQGQKLCSPGLLPLRDLLRGRRRASQVPRCAFPWLCFRSQTPDDPWRLASSGASGAAPSIPTLKASSLHISGLYSGALPPAVYASRRALPRTMQNSLPAD